MRPLLKVPLGDITLVFGFRVPGLEPPPPPLFVRLHVGVPRETDASDRIPGGPPYASSPRKVDVLMDLQADKKVALSAEWVDEMGNVATAPAGATLVYTVDDPTIIALTDNGDGTAEAAATGVLGTGNVHLEANYTDADGNPHTVTGDLQLVVVAGDAERLNIVAGAPEEVTPDLP